MATNTYIGAQGGNPYDPTNWSLGSVPGAGDTADLFGYAGVEGGATNLDFRSGVFAGSTIDISQQNSSSTLFLIGPADGYGSPGPEVYLPALAMIADTLGSAAAPVAIDVTADNVADSTADLILGTLYGSINVAAFQSLNLASVSTEIEIDGTVTVGAGATLTALPTIYSLGFEEWPVLTFNDNVVVDGGMLDLQALSVGGAGSLEIADGGTVVLNSVGHYFSKFPIGVSFDATGGTLVDELGLDQFTGKISGFGAGDVILALFGDISTTIQESYSNGVLSLLGPAYFAGSDTLITFETFAFTGDYSVANFSAEQVDGYLEITYQPCFAEGTAIATPFGARAVETIAAGDRVTLADGGTAQVVWVGHRRARETGLVRFHPGSLGEGVPHRDLVTSDDHAILVDGVLVPARLLVNGATILAERADATLFHVELERHAVLLAEGAPAESYLDTGNRAQFGNCPMLYDPVQALGEPYAELLLAGPRLAAVRDRLAAVPVLAPT